MVQNRNKLLDLFIGNLSNAALHRIMELGAADDELRKYYGKEALNSIAIARSYREKINPKLTMLPQDDGESIRRKIKERVQNRLRERITKGYENINLELIDKVVAELLLEMNILNLSSLP